MKTFIHNINTYNLHKTSNGFVRLEIIENWGCVTVKKKSNKQSLIEIFVTLYSRVNQITHLYKSSQINKLNKLKHLNRSLPFTHFKARELWELKTAVSKFINIIIFKKQPKNPHVLFVKSPTNLLTVVRTKFSVVANAGRKDRSNRVFTFLNVTHMSIYKNNDYCSLIINA